MAKKVWTGNTMWKDKSDSLRVEFLNGDGSGGVYVVDEDGVGHFNGHIRVSVDRDGYTSEGKILGAVRELLAA